MPEEIIKDGNNNVVLDYYDPEEKTADEVAAVLASHLTASTSLTFPAIASMTAAELTIPVTGAVVGNGAHATPNGSPNIGLAWTAYVSAAGVVTVRLANFTAASITPTARSWRVDVWQ